MGKIILTSLIALVLACTGQAQHPVYRQTYQPQYAVVKPIVVPVLVPSAVFQYLPAMRQQPTAVQPQAQNIDKIVQERVDAILRSRQVVDGNEPPPLILPAELLQSLPPPTTENLTGVQAVADLLGSKTCINCHTAGDGKPVKGNVTLFVKEKDQLFFQPSVSIKKIVDSVTPDSTGQVAMPPSGIDALKPAEVAILRTWDGK